MLRTDIGGYWLEPGQKVVVTAKKEFSVASNTLVAITSFRWKRRGMSCPSCRGNLQTPLMKLIPRKTITGAKTRRDTNAAHI